MSICDVTGKKVLVTGAGRGLGRQISDDLYDQGAILYGTSRDQATAEEIARRYGTIPLTVDVSDKESVSAFVDSLISQVGPLDALINNAGINIPKPSVDVTIDEWSTILETNLSGPFFFSTALGKYWLKSGTPGTIINIASQAGIVAIEDRAPYGASKAGLIHLTKVLALEWATNNIRVNAIAPTFIRTEMTKSTLSRKDWADELLSRIPMGRFGEPGDISGAVLFLISDASAFITGQTLVIDGGYTLR